MVGNGADEMGRVRRSAKGQQHDEARFTATAGSAEDETKNEEEMPPHLAALFRKLEDMLQGLITIASLTWLIGIAWYIVMMDSFYHVYSSDPASMLPALYFVGFGLSCAISIRIVRLLLQLYSEVDSTQRTMITRTFCLGLSLPSLAQMDWRHVANMNWRNLIVRITEGTINDLKEFVPFSFTNDNVEDPLHEQSNNNNSNHDPNTDTDTQSEEDPRDDEETGHVQLLNPTNSDTL